MWIKNLSIKNLRSIAELNRIELSKSINVLVGANNSGKSTVLNAISCLQPFETQGDFRTTFGPKFLRTGQSSFNIEICVAEPTTELLNLTPNFTVKNRTEVFIHFVGGAGKPMSVSLQVSGTSDVPIHTNPCHLREPDNFIYPYFSRRKPVEFDERVDAQAASSVEETHRSIFAKVDRLANQAFPESEEFREICRKLFDFEISCHPSQRGKQAGYSVSRTSHIPITAMGEGTVNLLAFLTHLLMAEGKVFLIEELENDIHPKALKLLLELIIQKSKTNQFIISTHSNIVAKYAGTVPDSKLFSLTMKVENRIPTSRMIEIPNTPAARMKVLEDLGYDVFDFELWKGYLILEESSAESIIKELLIPFFVPNLKFKLGTIAAGGNAEVEPRLNDFLRLFVFVHLSSQYKYRAWVGIDGDETGKKIIERLKAKFNDWPPEHFKPFIQKAFEKYYPARFQDEVTEILEAPKSDERREKKKSLVEKVIEWGQKNPQEAREEFEQSAEEIIVFLRGVDEQMNG